MALPQLHCRFCNHSLNHTFLDLGKTPLANSYLPNQADFITEKSYPLHARVCESCFLVQVESVVPAEEIFSDYAYFSSYSSSWVEHAKKFVHGMVERFSLNQASHVVEIASNDGYLLKHFVDLNIPCLGVEPAKNVAEVAIQAGVPTEVHFFGLRVANEILAKHGAADLLVANNVLAHVPDLNDFVAGLARLLSVNGVLSVECPHLLKLMQHTQFDTIYHEHYCYYSLLSLEKIFAHHGLRVFDVIELPTHGGSLRILAQRLDAEVIPETASLQKVRSDERESQLDQLAAYDNFEKKVNQVTADLKAFLKQAAEAGKTVVAYGAAAKGNTFLNYSGICASDILYAVDKNPSKQGHFLPGSHIPIKSPDEVFVTKPDYLLILPWNLSDEISKQMAGIQAWGGQFVTAVPVLRLFA